VLAPPPPPSLPYKVDTSRPSLCTNWTRLEQARFGVSCALHEECEVAPFLLSAPPARPHPTPPRSRGCGANEAGDFSLESPRCVSLLYISLLTCVFALLICPSPRGAGRPLLRELGLVRLGMGHGRVGRGAVTLQAPSSSSDFRTPLLLVLHSASPCPRLAPRRLPRPRAALSQPPEAQAADAPTCAHCIDCKQARPPPAPSATAPLSLHP